MRCGVGILRAFTGGRTLVERYLERGLHHLDTGEYEDAIADLSEAIAQEPYNAELYATRGFIYLESDNEEYLKYARADFDYALYLDPEQWAADYCLGMIAYAEEDYEEALRRFSAARERAPLRPEIYYYRALCHYRLGDPQRAAEEMDLAIQLFEPRDSRKRDAKQWLREFQKPAGQMERPVKDALPARPSLTGRPAEGERPDVNDLDQ